MSLCTEVYIVKTYYIIISLFSLSFNSIYCCLPIHSGEELIMEHCVVTMLSSWGMEIF